MIDEEAQEQEQRKLQIEEYQALEAEVEELFMEFSDADIHNKELWSLTRHFISFGSRMTWFENCSLIKQQERLEEMEGIRDSLLDLRKQLIPSDDQLSEE